MAYPGPLVPFVAFPANPPTLPLRQRGDLGGPDRVVHGEILEETETGVRLRVGLASGTTLHATVAIVGDATVRVLLEGVTGDERPVHLARALVAPAAVKRERAGEIVTLSTDAIAVSISLDPFGLVVRGPDGETLLEQNPGDVDVVGRLRNLPFGQSLVDGRRVALHDSFTLAPDEHFYGFGEKFTGLDKRGQRLEMWNYDALGVGSERAYKNVPFFFSTRGYGLFVDSVSPVVFDMGAGNHATFSVVAPDSALDYYVFAGPNPKQIISRYAELVGLPVLPRKWAFGLWVSSDFVLDGGTELVTERARLLDEHGIPSDVLHIDAQWQRHGSWSDLQWNTDLFADPAELIGALKARNLKVCLWMNPYLGHASDAFREASASGFLLRNPDGGSYVLDLWSGDHPPVGILDLANPQAVEWFKARLRPLLAMGVDVFKTDFGEGVPIDAVSSSGMTGSQLHNIYPLLYNDAVCEVTTEMTGRPGFVWGRSSFAGGQRHAAQWAGDPNSTYGDMAAVLRGGLSIGASGHPFWSHDIGGFNGIPTPELYVRWAQFGLLSPLARVHGNTTRIPWQFGPQAVELFRTYARLRYRLMPYIYTFAQVAAETSLPMLRAMVLEFPDDPSTYGLELQYLFGSDLLVAPIFNAEGRRTVYFPRGSWIDYWTNDVVDGPGHRSIEASLDVLPLYVRGNALIPTVEPGLRMGLEDEPFDLVTFDAYLLDRGSFELRDTDGSTHVSASQEHGLLDVTLEGQKRVIGLRVFQLGDRAHVDELRLNGRSVPRRDSIEIQLGAEPGWSVDSAGLVTALLEAG